MAFVTLPNLSVHTGFLTSEAAWGDNMNRNLRILDAMCNGRVVDKDLTAPPGSPTSGAMYIVGAGASGAWGTHGGKLAIWCIGDDIPAGEWVFVTAKQGWRFYVIDEEVFYEYNGSAWVADTAAGLNKYVTAIGNGSAGSFTVTHSLNTREIMVQLYRNVAPYDTLPESDYLVERNTVDQITVSGFAVTPSSNQWVVVIKK